MRGFDMDRELRKHHESVIIVYGSRRKRSLGEWIFAAVGVLLLVAVGFCASMMLGNALNAVFPW